MPSVAVLCEYPTMLGGERSWLANGPVIRGAGFHPLVLAPEKGAFAAALAAEGIEHVAWSVRDAAGRRRDLSALRVEFCRLLTRLRPSLVHANSLSMTRLAGPVTCEMRIPGLGHLRDIVRVSAAGIRDVNRADRLLAVSDATRRFHTAQGIDADRVHVLYNGVDLQAFRPRPSGVVAEDPRLAEPPLMVATIGQIGLRKGTDVFVELAGCVLAQRRDVHFLVIGERTSGKEEAVRLEAKLREQAALPPRRGHVHFLGTCTRVAELLSRVDLVVHAARQEPLGRVLIESAAAGKAIVATDVGGTPEIFPPDSQAAVLVPPCEVDKVSASPLLRATLRLLADRTQREMLGQAARRRAEAQFDARDAGQKLAQHYEALTH